MERMVFVKRSKLFDALIVPPEAGLFFDVQLPNTPRLLRIVWRRSGETEQGT